LSDKLLFEEKIEPGATWSHVLKRGTALTITDIEGGANVGALFYNFECPTERLNIPDTLKAQHIAKLTSGNVLYSDMGRILISIIDDTCGWHDPLGGHSTEQMVRVKYGESSYQQNRNDYFHNPHDSFLVELAKWGLGAADLCPNINFFSRLSVSELGAISFESGNSEPGAKIVLRAEMNVLTILNTCQHPLDSNPSYSPKPVAVTISKVDSPTSDDPCRISCPENERGFTLTERYFM
jgi:urea carboxylase-associated protein 2